MSRTSATRVSWSPSIGGNDVPEPELVTPELLRDWPLPGPASSKKSRGQVVVIGGAARTPGGGVLGGVGALRGGAGGLPLALAGSVGPAGARPLPPGRGGGPP